MGPFPGSPCWLGFDGCCPPGFWFAGVDGGPGGFGVDDGGFDGRGVDDGADSPRGGNVAAVGEAPGRGVVVRPPCG